MTKENKREFPDGIALVIGGSGGVGQAISERLSESGTDVAITYRGNKDGAEQAAAAVRDNGRQAQLVQMDAADSASICKSVDMLVQKYGHIHSVIIATGYDIKMTMIRDLEPETWRSVVDSDINGTFNIIHATLPHLREQGGSYVHISSAGLANWPALDVLSVAPKGAVQQLFKGVAREEGNRNVRANSIAIGVIDAGIFHRLKDTAFDAEWHEKTQATIALNRYGSPYEVADTAVFLASSRASYITGQTLYCDGGWSV